MDWESIDTAPRNGSPVRGRDRDGKVFICRWWSLSQLKDSKYHAIIQNGDHGWYEFIGEDGVDGDWVEPIFWRKGSEN
jgi:hypothetical protein